MNIQNADRLTEKNVEDSQPIRGGNPVTTSLSVHRGGRDLDKLKRKQNISVKPALSNFVLIYWDHK